MKRFLFLTLLGLICHARAFGLGGVTSNGGDPVAAEFTMMARQIAEVLRNHDNFPVQAEAFALAIESTWVVSKHRTFLHGQEVDAINYPEERRIEINRSRWLENNTSVRSRYVLVAHEYFGVLGIDDSRYQYSERLFEIPGTALFTVRCRAFSDGVLNFGSESKEQFLELSIYDSTTIAVVKNSEGEPPIFANRGVGETMITGSFDINEDGEDVLNAVITVNLGFFTRVVQVPISKDSQSKFRAKRWDIRKDAAVTSPEDVVCNQINW